MTVLEFFRQFDFFGKEPDFYFKGKKRQATVTGRIFTYLYIMFYILIFVYKMIRMAQRIDITFYDSYQNTDEIPKMRVTNNNFSLIFAVCDDYGEPFIDDTIYYPYAYFSGADEDLVVERCDPDKLSQEYKDYFEGEDMENYYCLGNFAVKNRYIFQRILINFLESFFYILQKVQFCCE